MTTLDLRTWQGHVEDVPDRCPRCFKKLLADVGPDAFGTVTDGRWCPNCDVPEARWSAYDGRARP